MCNQDFEILNIYLPKDIDKYMDYSNKEKELQNSKQNSKNRKQPSRKIYNNNQSKCNIL